MDNSPLHHQLVMFPVDTSLNYKHVISIAIQNNSFLMNKSLERQMYELQQLNTL